MSNEKIISFESVKSQIKIKKSEKLTEEDILNLILIFKYNNYEFLDINKIMISLGYYNSIEKFKKIYENLNIKIDKNNCTIVDLNNAYNKMIEKKFVINVSENEFMILANHDQISKLKETYHKNILETFSDLMFYIDNDLKYGLGNWELLFEDEVVKYPGYTSIVTGEFIGKEKDEEVMQKIKKISIGRWKNFYDK